MSLAGNIRKQICKQANVPAGTSPCSACLFILGTENEPYGGGENIVFALRDHTGRAICMRIQRSSTQGASYALKNEVDFRKSIESLGILGFQKVTGHSVEGNDLIPAPFITLEWAHGTTLRWTDTFPTNRGHRNKVIHAIARITVDLLKIQKDG